MQCEHDQKKEKLTINKLEPEDVNLEEEELNFFNMRLGAIENLEKAVNCKVE